MADTKHPKPEPVKLTELSREVFSRWTAELTQASQELADLGEATQRIRAKVATVASEIAVTVARLDDLEVRR